MKYLKQVENNSDKYVIVTNNEYNRLLVNTDNDYGNDKYPFYNNIPLISAHIKLYTLEEAEKEIPKITIYYKNEYSFRAMPLEELNTLLNANKFNI